MSLEQKNRMLKVFWLSAFAFAVFLVVYGIYNGEAEAVLRKAASICLECIGIG